MPCSVRYSACEQNSNTNSEFKSNKKLSIVCGFWLPQPKKARYLLEIAGFAIW